MTHLYTRGCEYALRALQAMAAHPDESVTVVELCTIAQVPEPFTRKMLQQLVRAGMLKSVRGPGGGFRFAKDPAEVSLMEVVTIIENGTRIDRCVLGSKDCDDTSPCPLHYQWAPIKHAANQMLETKTIQDLTIAAKPRKKRKKSKR